MFSQKNASRNPYSITYILHFQIFYNWGQLRWQLYIYRFSQSILDSNQYTHHADYDPYIRGSQEHIYHYYLDNIFQNISHTYLRKISNNLNLCLSLYPSIQCSLSELLVVDKLAVGVAEVVEVVDMLVVEEVEVVVQGYIYYFKLFGILPCRPDTFHQLISSSLDHYTYRFEQQDRKRNFVCS